MAKQNRLLLYGGVGVVIAAAFLMTDSPKPARPPKKPAASTASKSAKKNDDFDAADEKAVFEPVAVSSRDAFKPLIIRDGAGGSDSVAMPNQVPATFASGEAGWFYTGTAIVDQVPTALLENTQTGQGLYVKQGDMWKSCKIDRITPTSLTLSSGDRVRTLMLLADAPQGDSAPNVASQPLNPLSGPVGVQSRPSSVPGSLPTGPRPGAPTAPPTAPPTGGQSPDPQFSDLNLLNEANR